MLRLCGGSAVWILSAPQGWSLDWHCRYLFLWPYCSCAELPTASQANLCSCAYRLLGSVPPRLWTHLRTAVVQLALKAERRPLKASLNRWKALRKSDMGSKTSNLARWVNKQIIRSPHDSLGGRCRHAKIRFCFQALKVYFGGGQPCIVIGFLPTITAIPQ